MNATAQPAASQAFVKIFAKRCDLPPRAFIDIFHRWIRDGATGELLVDVHDYSHVQDGPGVILVGHTCHYGMDRRGGELGLVYRARRTPPAPVDEALTIAAQALVAAARRLENDTNGALELDPSRLLVGFEDRLHAPNDATTFERFGPVLTALVHTWLGPKAKVEHAGESRDVFSARLTGEVGSLADLAELL